MVLVTNDCQSSNLLLLLLLLRFLCEPSCVKYAQLANSWMWGPLSEGAQVVIHCIDDCD